MEGLNKIIFLVLGLIAVIIFFAVLTGRINLKGKLPTFSDIGKKVNSTPTPTVSKTEPTTVYKRNSINPTPNNQSYTKNNQTKNPTKTITSIPATGVPVLFLTAAFALLGAGIVISSFRR